MRGGIFLQFGWINPLTRCIKQTTLPFKSLIYTVDRSTIVFCDWAISSSAMLYAQHSEFLYLAYASSPRKQPTLSQHFTDVEGKKCKENHFTSRTVIKAPDQQVLWRKVFRHAETTKRRQTVERRRWENKKEWKTEVRAVSILQNNFMSYFSPGL